MIRDVEPGLVKKAYLYRFKSDIKPWVNSTSPSVDFTEFVEVRGPRGGRMCIDVATINAQLSITVATATAQGEDLARAIRTATLEQKDGVRRYNEITGDALRLCSYAFFGPEATKEQADFAVGGPTTINVTMPLALTKPQAYEPSDFTLAAELLKTIKVGMATGADMSQGTSAVTVNSGSYWILVEGHEEMSVVHHSVDEVVQRDFDASLQTKLVTDGRLHDLILFIRGQNGGQSLANLTEAWVEHLMPQSLTVNPDLTTLWERRKRDATNLFSTKGNPVRTDPFVFAERSGTLRACAVMLSTGAKVFEGPVRDTVVIKTTQSSALPGNLTAIARIIRPRSERVSNSLKSRYGMTSGYVKTAGKSQRDPRSWRDDHAAYLPEKLLKPAARAGVKAPAKK